MENLGLSVYLVVVRVVSGPQRRGTKPIVDEDLTVRVGSPRMKTTVTTRATRKTTGVDRSDKVLRTPSLTWDPNTPHKQPKRLVQFTQFPLGDLELVTESLEPRLRDTTLPWLRLIDLKPFGVDFGRRLVDLQGLV